MPRAVRTAGFGIAGRSMIAGNRREASDGFTCGDRSVLQKRPFTPMPIKGVSQSTPAGASRQLPEIPAPIRSFMVPDRMPETCRLFTTL